MNFNEWVKKNSVNYRGYVIRPGSIWKKGELEYLLPSPIGSGLTENMIDEAKKIIDKAIEREIKS